MYKRQVQGAFVSDEEVSAVVGFIKEQNGQVTYSAEMEEKLSNMESANTTVAIDSGADAGDGRDVYFADAARLLMEKEKGSIGMLQRYFKIGFNRAARIMAVSYTHLSKIVNLADDIKLNLAAADIRIEAPIPGKAAIGIEVPNKENVMVSFRELVESEEFKKHPDVYKRQLFYR